MRPATTTPKHRRRLWGSNPVVTDPAEPRRPGRPRDAGADEAILNAVVEVLGETGFSGLTVDAVAQRAGVGKATIYRRWDGKERLVLDALAPKRIQIPNPDTGSVREDLLEFYLPLSEPDAQRGAIRLMPALAAEAADNAELAERLQAYVAMRRAPVVAIFERAIERGEVPADADVDLLIDLVTGPVMYRLYFSGTPVEAETITAIVDLVLQGARA